MKTYYELLDIAPAADPEEVKRAFRREIARYHPDKVQHLGPEFQEIAATRAAELTEAYRILMDPAARQRYDAGLEGGDKAAQARPARSEATPAPTASTAPPPPAAPRNAPPAAPVHEHLRQTQASLSQFVKKATICRLREGIEAVFGAAETLPITGFDAAFSLKPRRGMFQKAEPPVKLLARVVERVDAPSVAEAWPLAVKEGSADRMVCLLLLGAGLASSREIAAAIAEQRRRTRQVAPVVVPVDTRDWDALLPPETPSGVRKLLERLKQGV